MPELFSLFPSLRSSNSPVSSMVRPHHQCAVASNLCTPHAIDIKHVCYCRLLAFPSRSFPDSFRGAPDIIRVGFNFSQRFLAPSLRKMTLL